MLDLSDLIDLYSKDFSANFESELEFKTARKYYHSKQLPEDVKAYLKEQGGFEFYENIFKTIINKILGYKMQSSQEVKVSGTQEQDRELAALLNDLLKVFSHSEFYDREIAKRDLNLMFGMGAAEIYVEKDSDGDFHIKMQTISPDCILIDKHSKNENANDARRIHRKLKATNQEWRDFFGSVFEFKSIELDSMAIVNESYIKTKDGWERYFWDNEKIYFKEKNIKNHPFVIYKYAIDSYGKWYGIFREIKPIQDYINYAEIRQLNMMATLKVIFESGAVENADDFVEQIKKDNAVCEVNVGALQKIQFVQHNAQISELNAKAQEKRNLARVLSGLNDEALGLATGSHQSGVAIAQRREAGLMGLQNFIRICDEMDKAIFKKVLDLMQEYFTQKQVFKIVDKAVGERYFSINTNAKNKIRIGKFDLQFKTQLKASGREERFSAWSEMLKTIASIKPDLAPQLLKPMLKDTDSPVILEVEEIIKANEEAEAQNAQAQAQELQEQQAQIAQIESAKAQAQIAKTQAEAAHKQAQAQAILSGASNDLMR